MSVPAKLGGELVGEAESWDGAVLQLVSLRPFAPGAPLSISLLLAHASLELDAKSLGSKKREDERFDVRVRLVNLRREARLALDASFGR